MYAQIDVVGSPVDLHSGGYGGAVENPANALAQIIAALKGPDGRIRIPGFYDDVVPLTDADRAALAALPFDEEAYPASDRRAGAGRRGRLLGPRAAGRAPDARRQRHLGRLPGRREQDDHPGPCPCQGQLPARRGAGSRCGSSSAFAAYVAGDRPAGRDDHGHVPRRRPAEPDADRPSRRPRRRRARSRRPSAGRRVYIREGGSIPVCASFESILGLPVVLLGFTPPDDHAHAPNEWMDLRQLRDRRSGPSSALFDELVGLPR